jgi:hypothetical protein
MKKKLFGAVVAPISILGLTFALGLGSSAFGTAGGDEQQTDEDSLINTLNVTTDIPVAPWCGWYVSGGDDGDLTLVPAVDAPTQYIGTEIALTATATENTAYVGPSAGLSEEGIDADCSWFTEFNKYGARYDVEADGYAFTAATVGGLDDDEMDFEADDSNPLIITNVGIDACLAEGFTTNPTAEIKETNLTTTPWTVLTEDVNNTNFCQWSAKYEIKIPLGMSPTYGNVTYRWTGPTLTHTLIIPETQP